MKKIMIIWAIAFILAAGIVYAEDNRTLELSSDYFTGENFELNDQFYSVNVNSYDRVFLTHGEDFIVIKKGTCTWQDVYYEFCLTNVEYDTDENDKKASIEIYSYIPEIDSDRKISKPTLIVGEQTNITVRLENTGHAKARNVTFIDNLPAGINMSVPTKFYDVKVKDKKIVLGNGSVQWIKSVIWQGDLDIDDVKTFYYKITPVKPMKEELYATVYYKKGFENVIEPTDSFDLTVEPYTEVRVNMIDMDYKNAPGTVDIDNWESVSPYAGQELLLVVDLVNRYPENRSVNVSELRIYFPEGAMFIEPYTFRIFGNSSAKNSSYLTGYVPLRKVSDTLYTWSGEIPKSGKTFAMKIKVTKEGKQRIRVSGDFRKDQMPAMYDISAYHDFDAKMEEIDLNSNFDDGQQFASGQREYMTIYLVNPNTFINFTDVNVTVSSPWFNGVRYIDMIKGFGYADIFNSDVTMPSVTRSEPLKFFFNVTYQTEFGHKLNKEFEKSIRVDPLSDLIVSHDIRGTTVKNSGPIEISNKENLVELKIENKIDKDIKSVSVTEAVDPSLDSSGNLKVKLLKLRKNEVNEIFKYKIDPPDSSKQQNFTIRTYVAYSLDNSSYNLSFDVNVIVKPKVMDIDIIKNVLEDNPSKGQLIHASYDIKNTEKEPIKNIVVKFPVQHETDLVGARNFTIDQLNPEETFVVSNEELIRLKENGSTKLEATEVTFEDMNGNKFTDHSTSEIVDAEQGFIETPAIFINKTAPDTVDEGEPFTVNITLTNKGKAAGTMDITPLGESIKLVPGQTRSFTYNTSVNDSGLVKLSQDQVSYSYNGLDYVTGTQRVEVYSRAKKEEKPPVQEEPRVEEVPVPEKKWKFNIKYLYLMGIIIIVVLIIWFILKREPKTEEGLEFLEK